MRRSTVLSLPSQLAFLGEADFNHFNFKTLSLSLSLLFAAFKGIHSLHKRILGAFNLDNVLPLRSFDLSKSWGGEGVAQRGEGDKNMKPKNDSIFGYELNHLRKSQHFKEM